MRPSLLLLAFLQLLIRSDGVLAQEPDMVPGEIHIGRLHYSGGGDWYSDPSSLPNLLREFERRSGIDCAEQETVIRATDPGLARLPFVYLTGHGNIALTAGEEAKLRSWLENGGFLWGDDHYSLDKPPRRVVERRLPASPLRLAPASPPLTH